MRSDPGRQRRAGRLGPPLDRSGAAAGSSSKRGRVKIAVASSPWDRNHTASISRKIGESAGRSGRATTGAAGAGGVYDVAGAAYG